MSAPAITPLGRRCADASCRTAIDDLAPDAKFCSPACKQRTWRKQQKLASDGPPLSPSAGLRHRYTEALKEVARGGLDTPSLLDLLAAVCWPDDERLQLGPERRAA
jgi:hypothetical protein